MKLTEQTLTQVMVRMSKGELLRIIEVLGTVVEGPDTRCWPAKYKSDLKLLRNISNYVDSRTLHTRETVNYGRRGLCPIVDMARKNNQRRDL